jgi:hypothetical protein
MYPLLFIGGGGIQLSYFFEHISCSGAGAKWVYFSLQDYLHGWLFCNIAQAEQISEKDEFAIGGL